MTEPGKPIKRPSRFTDVGEHYASELKQMSHTVSHSQHAYTAGKFSKNKTTRQVEPGSTPSGGGGAKKEDS